MAYPTPPTGQVLNVQIDAGLSRTFRRSPLPNSRGSLNNLEDDSSQFVKLPTATPTTLLLILSYGVFAFVIVSHDDTTVQAATRIQVHAGLFFISLLFNQYCAYYHQRVRAGGYLRLDRETSSLWSFTSSVFAIGNAVLLICYAIWFELNMSTTFTINAFRFDLVMVVVFIEILCVTPLLIVYIRRVRQHNDAHMPPDLFNTAYVSRVDDITSTRRETQALLEEQGDMIEYLKNKTETLMKQVQDQQKRLRQYEGLSSKDYYEPALVSSALENDAEDDLLRNSSNVDDLRRAIHNKRKTVKQLEAETRSLVEQKNELIRANRDLKLDVESLQQQVATLKIENRQYRTAAVEYADEKKRMQARLDAQREAEAKALRQVAEVRKQLDVATPPPSQ